MSTLVAGGTVQDNLLNTQKAAVPTLTGNEGQNQNLIIRSTTNTVKGAVLFDENTPSYGFNNGALQAIGGIGSQHNITAGGVFLHSPYGMSVNNVVMFQQGSYGTVSSVTVGANTFSFPALPTVTFTPPQLPGGQVAKGYAVLQSNLVIQVVITDPGTGYTIPPNVIFSEPTPSANTVSIVATVGITVSAGQFVKAFQTTGAIFYYIVTTGGAITSNPTFSSGSSAAAGPTMTFIGALAQAYPNIGYTGAQLQGAIQSVGCVTQVVLTAAGSSYAVQPRVTFSAPDLPGGRIATGIAQISGGAVTKIDIIDPGTGYLYPPTVTITALGAGSGATANAVIGAPSSRAIVSSMTGVAFTSGSFTSYAPAVQAGTFANNYYIDFSHQGNEVVFIQSTNTSTIYFDSINNTTSGFALKNGYTQGRRISLYFKNSAAPSVTVSFPNLQGVNSNTGSNSFSIGGNRTARFDFIVIHNTNTQTAASPPLSIDVYCTAVIA